MSIEAHKATIRRYVDEVQNQGNLSVIDEIAAPRFVNHSAPPGYPPTLDGVKQLALELRAAFPDGSMSIEDMVAEGDRVATRKTFHGTHQAPFMGIPATGRSVAIGMVELVRFEDGKVIEHWLQADMLGMFQQLGVVQTGGS